MLVNTIQITLGIPLGKGSANLPANANTAKNQRIGSMSSDSGKGYDRELPGKIRTPVKTFGCVLGLT